MVPGAAIVGALIIGPSLGHFYAARPGRAFLGIGIRTLAGVGIAAAFADELGEGTDHPHAALGGIGAVLGGVSLAWDIARAPHSAQVHNDHVRESRRTIGIAPSFGSAGLGLCAAVAF